MIHIGADIRGQEVTCGFLMVAVAACLNALTCWDRQGCEVGAKAVRYEDMKAAELCGAFQITSICDEVAVAIVQAAVYSSTVSHDTWHCAIVQHNARTLRASPFTRKANSTIIKSLLDHANHSETTATVLTGTCFAHQQITVSSSSRVTAQPGMTLDACTTRHSTIYR